MTSARLFPESLTRELADVHAALGKACARQGDCAAAGAAFTQAFKLGNVHELRYTAACAAALAATGRLDFEQLVKLAEKYCGEWPRVEAPRSPGEPRFANSRKALVDPKLNRQYTMGMTPGPSAQDDRRFAARVLADVIGDSDGSRFYWALVDNAIADEADFGFYPHDACGSFYVSLTTDPERTAKALDIGMALQ